MAKNVYELVGGPFDGVRIESEIQIDNIKLETPHALPKNEPSSGTLKIYEVCEAEYKDSALQEWQLEQYKAFPLFYNGINPFSNLDELFDNG